MGSGNLQSLTFVLNRVVYFHEGAVFIKAQVTEQKPQKSRDVDAFPPPILSLRSLTTGRSEGHRSASPHPTPCSGLLPVVSIPSASAFHSKREQSAACAGAGI